MKKREDKGRKKGVSVKSWEKLGQLRSPSPEELGLLNKCRVEKWVFTRVALV